ncbi:MAG: ABC transporter ATP-binding protein [Betaproteobacteria bacterium]
MSRAATIELRGVTKAYGDVVAVREVGLTIEAATLVTLLGPSGCGKTTTLRMVAGLELPSKGEILIGGRDVSGLPAYERDVGMVFQSYALFPHLNVIENVAYGIVQRAKSRAAAERTAGEALETVGLSGMAERLPSELSGGQQQRVAVARALVLEPAVLLFDEPLSNLDAKLRRSMREEIRALQRRTRMTVIYVTHDQDEALAVSDRIVVMNQAVIAQQGTPRELYESPDSVFVAGFIGDANLLKGTLRRLDATQGRLRFGSFECLVPNRGLPDGEVAFAARPEAFSVAAAGTARAEVLHAAYLGRYMEYRLRCELGELFVRSPDVNPAYDIGAQVALSVAGSGIALLRP